MPRNLLSSRTARLTIVLLGILLSGPVLASGRWYQVEVVLFRYADASATGGETWAAPMSLPNFRDAVELITDLPDFDDEPENLPNTVRIPGPIAFQPLGRAELKMSGVFRTLRNRSQYQPILHVGWRQPGFGSSRARSVYISDKPAVRVPDEQSTKSLIENVVEEERIEGTVKLRTGRLLHLDVDFVSFGQENPVRITEQRKIKFKELHYFDHPLFGVIVQVTPYRVPQPGNDSAESATVSSQN